MIKQQFSINNQKTVDKLTELVIGLTHELGIELKGLGGFRSITRPIDDDSYDFMMAGTKVGAYNFTFQGNAYNCLLDVSGVPLPTQHLFLDTVKRNFPEFAAQYQE